MERTLVLFSVFFRTATVCSCELISSIVFGRYFSTHADDQPSCPAHSISIPTSCYPIVVDGIAHVV